MPSHFLVAAPHSGAGKTTVTLGLLYALRRQGRRVQPFKCGPDYIDPIHHRTAAGRDSINLDGYMMSAGHIRDLYARYGANADVCITEGVMGLFDGAVKRQGSSAELAILLDLPVILVLNAKAMAYSAAALLYGLKNFDARLRIAGVLFNFVDSPAHYRILQDACADVGVTALGHLPDNKALSIPSRHLGLNTADAGETIDAAAEHITRHVDLATLLAATASATAQTLLATPEPRPVATAPSRSIFIARDAAFHFLYTENVRRLEEYGQVRYFSPLNDSRLPDAAGDALLYLPGGYPELYLEMLSQNRSMLQAIRDFAAGGGRIIAECGGMMYLGAAITDSGGQPWPMTGLLDITTSMAVKKLSLGYRSAEVDGHILRGHEFHYSQLVGPAPPAPAVVRNAHGQPVETMIFHRPNLLATYMHFYWGEDPALLSLLEST